LNKDETEEMEKVFKSLDENGDGMLSKEEVLNGYESHFGVPINEQEVDKLFEAVDTDGSGTIDYTEFVVATMNEKNLLTKDKLENAFKMFDKVDIVVMIRMVVVV
jgi:calcium-dependent protein kinase